MASVEHTAHGSGKADSNPASGEITIRRGALLNETSAGIRFKKGKERKGSRESEWVKIDQQTVTEYTNLLDGHIRRLKEVQDANPEFNARAALSIKPC